MLTLGTLSDERHKLCMEELDPANLNPRWRLHNFVIAFSLIGSVMGPGFQPLRDAGRLLSAHRHKLPA